MDKEQTNLLEVQIEESLRRGQKKTQRKVKAWRTLTPTPREES